MAEWTADCATGDTTAAPEAVIEVREVRPGRFVAGVVGGPHWLVCRGTRELAAADGLGYFRANYRWSKKEGRWVPE